MKVNMEKVLKPPGIIGTRHIQCLLISISLMIAYATRNCISIALVDMTDANSTDSGFKKYEWAPNQRSLILSSFLWGYAVSQVPSGYLGIVWSAQKLFTTALLLSGVLSLLTPFLADNGGWIAICASRVVMGLIQACLLSSVHTMTSKWAPPLERSRMNAYSGSGAELGSVVATGLSGLISASSLGWPGIFYTYGIASVIMSLILFFNLADSPALHPKISQEEKTYIMDCLKEKECQVKKIARPPWMKIMTSMPMWAIIVAHSGSNWCGWTLQTEMPAYVKSVLKFGISKAGLISALFYVASWVSAFLSSWLADLAITKGLSVSLTRRISNTIGMWGPAFALAVVCFVDTFSSTWPVVMLVIAGASRGFITAGFNVNHIDLSPNFAGAMYAISNGVSTVMSILAPIVCGYIVEDSVDPEPWHMVFYITAGISFIANVFYIIFARGKTLPWNVEDRRMSIVSIGSIYDPKFIAVDT